MYNFLNLKGRKYTFKVLVKFTINNFIIIIQKNYLKNVWFLFYFRFLRKKGHSIENKII